MRGMNIITALGLTAAFSAAAVIAAQNVEIERDLTGDFSLMELGCNGFDPKDLSVSTRDPACEDGQNWIQILSTSGKSFDISHGFDYAALKEEYLSNAKTPVNVTFTLTAWNVMMGALPFDLSDYKTDEAFYIVPDAVGFD